MSDRSYLDWPFFEPRHKTLANELDTWAHNHLAQIDHSDVDSCCRSLVSALGQDGWLQPSAAAEGETLDVRS